MLTAVVVVVVWGGEWLERVHVILVMHGCVSYSEYFPITTTLDAYYISIRKVDHQSACLVHLCHDLIWCLMCWIHIYRGVHILWSWKEKHLKLLQYADEQLANQSFLTLFCDSPHFWPLIYKHWFRFTKAHIFHLNVTCKRISSKLGKRRHVCPLMHVNIKSLGNVTFLHWSSIVQVFLSFIKVLLFMITK